MRRFRDRRRRRAALALIPATAVLSIGFGAGTAAAKSPELDASKSKVKAGKKVRLAGQFPAKASTRSSAEPTSRKVRIQFRPAGKKGWRDYKATTHDNKGRYTQRVKIRRSGYFRAVHVDGRRSERERVRAKAKLRSWINKRNLNLGDKLKVKGKVKPTFSRRTVIVRVGGEKLKTRTNRKGKFKVRWKADKTGKVSAKLKARGNKVAAGDFAKAGRATVYRPAQASWYGPGFYGNRTACGQTLTTSTVGVAHKTMPCGTKLKLRYKGRSVRAKVIDRGPYSGNREFDLTSKTKQKLGFPDVGTVYVSK